MSSSTDLSESAESAFRKFIVIDDDEEKENISKRNKRPRVWRNLRTKPEQMRFIESSIVKGNIIHNP